MKINLIFLIVFATFSLSCIRKETIVRRIKLLSGEKIEVIIYKEYNLADQVWIIRSFTENEILFGLSCDNKMFKNVADEIWTEIQKSTDVSKIKVISIHIRQSKKGYCGYLIGRDEKEDWRKLF